MLQFDYPWLFALLPLPLLIWWLVPPYRERTQALRMPFLEQIAAATGATPGPGAVVPQSNLAQKILAPLCWLLLVAALAAPQWVGKPIEQVQSARDLLLAIDLSQSMETRDFIDPANGNTTDRLSAVKTVVDDFIARRSDDRIGLIVFGSGAFPQTPLTLDHTSVRALLDETRIGMAGPQTAIGDAIGIAIKLLEDNASNKNESNVASKPAPNERVLILLTDGNDTASRLPPAQAAKIAQQHNLVIHTIGIGDPQASGENRVDLDALRKIADVTGGRSFRGEDRRQLEDIYTTLDRITQHKVTRATYRPKQALYWIPLAACALLVTLYHGAMLLANTARLRRALAAQTREAA